MALGGGTWVTQNKILPGTYINKSSVAKATASLSDRGVAAMPLVLDWGPDSQVFTVTSGDFMKNSLKLFGYAYADDEMLPLRELFKYARTVHAYRLNSGGAKASNNFATAKYAGTVGNKLSIVIAVSADNEDAFVVDTYYDTALIDSQTVTSASALVGNDFIDWKSNITLEATAKTPLAGGTNGVLANSSYQNFLDKIESYSFNTLGCPTSDATITGLFVNFTKRMLEEVGANFQTVIFNQYGDSKLADYEGVIAVGNYITAENAGGFGAFGLVYWVTGAQAGCEVNQSLTNKAYDGECDVYADYTQSDLEKALKAGRFMLHNVNGEIRVLEDINSLVTTSDEKGDDFKSNQTIRVIQEASNSIALTFNTRYLGVVPNDNDGRVSLWNDICKVFEELGKIRAVEDFDSANVEVAQGDTKKSVVCGIENLNVVNAMEQLYVSMVIV